ncbi:nucleotidyltransferase domain-containing protein [Bacillus sp. FJAT-42376]|uniref:nucleotidyltransferase domain-containing protein n=1 Tax=Bacillus sp. FJAT-42376 TaxID=2014076 RepID=UPI000F4E6DB1|nr:nucleotidyltransferase domain-containing protein [Bacillus sp. FJAT-42376]AZB43473.1 nucleotidyltransferase domain-containing protein [Bacillus sp. FJAT-42376]
MDKIEPFTAAAAFVKAFHPDCDAAILAGSAGRGEEKSSSDLDIIIFTQSVTQSYRESLYFHEWPVELFVHSLTSYKKIYDSDRARANPCMQRMVWEGRVIKDSGIAARLKKEAEEEWRKGPESWTKSEIERHRYFISDAAADLVDSLTREEQIFTVQALSDLIYEFYMRINGQWIGSGKWKYRSLAAFNAPLANDFLNALDDFYRRNQLTSLNQLIDRVLLPYGGRLFDGFSIGK